MFDTLKLQAYKLQPNLNIELYRYTYPQQWIKSFQKVSFQLNKEKKHMPFKHIKEFLFSWDPDIVYVNDLTNTFRDDTWILSRKPIDETMIIAIFKICLNVTIEKILNLNSREVFTKWFEGLESVDKLERCNQLISLINENGEIHENNMAFEILPRLVYRELKDSPLKVQEKKIPFFVTSEGLLSQPDQLFYEYKNKKYYYSVKIVAQIQTTPHTRMPMLQFKFSISRWMRNTLPIMKDTSNTATYIQMNERLMKLAIINDGKSCYWDKTELEMFKSIYIGHELPNIEELIATPHSFSNVFVAHRFNFGKIATGAGETMKDRELLNNWISQVIKGYVQPMVPVIKGTSVIGQNSKEKIALNLQDSEKIIEVLSKATGRNQLNIEVFYMGKQDKLIEELQRNFLNIFGITEGEIEINDFKITINYSQQNEILSALDKNLKKIERHEQKIQQIASRLNQVTEITMCLVLLPFLMENEKNYYSKNVDPKKAIRAGLATTGRLSQFIDCTFPENVEHRVKVAVLDLLRQLGYVDPFETRKYKTINYDTAISAIHIVNSKDTPYGRTKRAFVYIEREEGQGPIKVECPALWSGKKYYWEASLAFQNIATYEGLKLLKPDRVIRDIKNKIFELSYQKNKPHLLLIFGDGITRVEWPFITDKNLSSTQKKEQYTLKSIWFEKGKENDGLNLDDSNQLRIIRVRNNQEVPDYLTPRNSKGDFQSKTGIFTLDGVFYSIGQKPNDKEYNNTRYASNSKVLMEFPNKTCKVPNMVELYPIHLNPSDDPNEWISLVHNYREFAHQYKGTLQSPILLHMATQLEEYI